MLSVANRRRAVFKKHSINNNPSYARRCATAIAPISIRGARGPVGRQVLTARKKDQILAPIRDKNPSFLRLDTSSDLSLFMIT
jgi:hypothetical protein